MTRTLLLCFIHGFKVSEPETRAKRMLIIFKGDDDTFRTFPSDLQKSVVSKLPDHNVESIVYPKYETRGELGQCCVSFLSW